MAAAVFSKDVGPSEPCRKSCAPTGNVNPWVQPFIRRYIYWHVSINFLFVVWIIVESDNHWCTCYVRGMPVLTARDVRYCWRCLCPDMVPCTPVYTQELYSSLYKSAVCMFMLEGGLKRDVACTSETLVTKCHNTRSNMHKITLTISLF
jgi:hypothetical protein